MKKQIHAICTSDTTIAAADWSSYRKGKEMVHQAHVVVYIDHAEAFVSELTASGTTEQHIIAKDRSGNIHHKAGSMGSGHEHDSEAYLRAVASALQPSHEILIVGHGTAKNEFASFIRDHLPALAARIIGVETVDHPTKGEVIALAREYFKARDRMLP